MDPASGVKREGDDQGKGKNGELAKSGDGDHDMNSILEGQLLKFTSILKGGFLPRWFVLDPGNGTLTYYLSQEALKKKASRGQVGLPGAQVCPSEEDSQTFSVNAANGEIFKLKAHDAKERQLWVSHLRHVVESHAPKRSMSTSGARTSGHIAAMRTESAGNSVSRSATLSGQGSRSRTQPDGAVGAVTSAPSIGDRERKKSSKSRETSPHASMSKKRNWDFKKLSSTHSTSSSVTSLPAAAMPDDMGALQPIHQACALASQQEQELRALLEQNVKALRKFGATDVHSDPNVLLMKATAQANLTALHQCLSLLVEYQQRLKAKGLTLDTQHLDHSDLVLMNIPVATPLTQSDNGSIRSHPDYQHSTSVRSSDTGVSSTSSSTALSEKTSATSVTSATPADESSSTKAANEPSVNEDTDDLLDADNLYNDECGVLQRQLSMASLMEKENRGLLMNLCSKLKLGMDLTTVSFPVSLLDGRSLLELFADLFSHSQLFLQIAEAKTPCQRMIAVVRHYICAFHTAFQHQQVRKPYNARLGEVFRCELDPPSRRMSSVNAQSDLDQKDPTVHFVAEQVSHHPPVSAFHVSARGLSLTADVTCKSKFLGMSAGVDISGQGCLTVSAHNEDYIFTFPSVYCRSILTNPWLEFNGRVKVTCPQSAYQATITFPAKPSYGDEYNKVSAEIRPQAGSAAVCKISGRWDGILTTTHDNGETEVMDITHLSHSKKLVQPMKNQSKMESRRAWRRVTAALKEGDYKLATMHKNTLEDEQREQAEQRAATGTEWKPKHFEKDGERWKFRPAMHSTDV
eukprot:scpid49945/ scgid25193/ Oxysterol-binding protein-related protein 11